MEQKSILGNIVKIVLPFVLGGAILWWMYRGEDLSTIDRVVREEMNWTWMLLSFPFGILAQMFRGWRWKQTLDPIQWKEEREKRKENRSAIDSANDNSLQGNLLPHSSFLFPLKKIRISTCIHAVFISYAASLVIVQQSFRNSRDRTGRRHLDRDALLRHHPIDRDERVWYVL